MRRGEVERADALYLQQPASSRSDKRWLREYGELCLRTGRAERARWLFFRATEMGGADAALLSRFGYAQLESGEPQAAKDLFEAAVAADPTHAESYYGLAACLRLTGAWAAAAAQFEHALAAQPGTAPILLDLAEARHKAGDDARARADLQEVRALAPDDPAILLEAARLAREVGDLEGARAGLDRCRALQPRDPATLLESARCLRAQGQLRPAIAWLDSYNKALPGRAEYHEELGNCLQLPTERSTRDHHWGIAASLWIRQDELEPAEALLGRMATASPGYVATWVLSGMLDVARKRFDSAIAAFRKAIEVDRNWIDGHANLANCLEQVNRIPEAEAAADSGLRLADSRRNAPENTVRSLLMTSIKVSRRNKRYEQALALCDRMERMNVPVKERQMVAFERARIFDQMGRCDDAIAWFASGNGFSRAAWDAAHPGRNSFLRGVEYMQSLFRQGWSGRWSRIDGEPRQESPQPAFLIGFPRSGTTLLNQVLYCHSAIDTIEEQPPVHRMRNAVLNMPDGYPHSLAAFDRHDAAWLKRVYWQEAVRHGASENGGKLLVDKFPLHTTLAPLIHRVFPHAKFIFAVRHPCDVVLSCFMQDFKANEGMANFFTLADAATLYVRVMELWDAYREALPLDVHTIRYEDVVDDFRGRIGSLCDFLGVRWEEELAKFDERSSGRGRIPTPSYEQVSRPIYREARFRWERYRKHLEPFLPALRPWIVRWGYDDPLA